MPEPSQAFLWDSEWRLFYLRRIICDAIQISFLIK